MRFYDGMKRIATRGRAAPDIYADDWKTARPRRRARTVLPAVVATDREGARATAAARLQRPRGRRVAVVTGGSSGIGEATARLLTRRGWHCVLLARGEERLRAVAEELGGECGGLRRRRPRGRRARRRRGHASATPRSACSSTTRAIPGRGGLPRAPTRSSIEYVLRVNYLGSLWCLRAFLPALEAAAPSHVVNVVSVAGTVAYPGSGPYGASKHAQLAFSRGVAARAGVEKHPRPYDPSRPGRDRGLPAAPQPAQRAGPPLVAEPALVAERIVARGRARPPRDLRPAVVPERRRSLQALAPSLVARVGAAVR